MDKAQAEKIGDAILEPGIVAQRENRRKLDAQSLKTARNRQVAWFILGGYGIGALVAYFIGQRIFFGGICGGVVGAAVGWLIFWLRRTSPAK